MPEAVQGVRVDFGAEVGGKAEWKRWRMEAPVSTDRRKLQHQRRGRILECGSEDV